MLLAHLRNLLSKHPKIGGGLSTLANYIADSWWYGYAKDRPGKHYPGSPGKATSENITMWENGKAVSYVDLYGTYTMWFLDEGPAY